MKNLKNADESGIVTEMIKYTNEAFKSALVTCFNQILLPGSFDECWFTFILQMLPNDGDLNEFKNLSLIASLQICYKYFLNLFTIVFLFIYSHTNPLTSTNSSLVYGSKMLYSARKSSLSTTWNLI